MTTYEVLINGVWTIVRGDMIAGDGSLIWIGTDGHSYKSPVGKWRMKS